MAKRTSTKASDSRPSGKQTLKDVAGPKKSRERVVHRSPKTDTISHTEARKAIYRYINQS